MTAARAGRLNEQDRPFFREARVSPASGGGCASSRRPPSTISPPWKKPCSPMPERAAAPESVRQGFQRGVVVAGELAAAPDDGQAELGSDAEADVLGRRGDDLDSAPAGSRK